jgi:hypothetical protein
VSEDWYCKIVGIEMGPMSFDDLGQLARRGNLRQDHYVRNGTAGEWLRASAVPGLCSSDDPSAASLDFDTEPIAGSLPLPLAAQRVVDAGRPRRDPRPSSPQHPLQPTASAAAPAKPKEPVQQPKPAPPPRQAPAPQAPAAPAAKGIESVRPQAALSPSASKLPEPEPAPAPTTAAPAKPKEKAEKAKPKKPPKAEKPPKTEKPPKQAKPVPIQAAGKGGGPKIPANLVLAAAVLIVVSLGGWALFGRGGGTPKPSVAEISDRDLIAACRQLHDELKRARGTELTAQTLNGFEMQFQKKINSLRFQMRGTPAGSARQSVNNALSCLNEMPRCAVNPSDSAAFQEHEEKLERMLAEAAQRAGI